MEWIKTSKGMPSAGTPVLGLYIGNEWLFPFGVYVCGYGSRYQNSDEIVIDRDREGEPRWWIASLNDAGGGHRAPDYWIPCPAFEHLLELNQENADAYTHLYGIFPGQVVDKWGPSSIPPIVRDEGKLYIPVKRPCTGLPEPIDEEYEWKE